MQLAQGIAGAAPYELSVDGVRPLSVHAIHGSERISEPWWFDVVVTAREGQDIEQAALGKRATLLFNVDDKPRAFYGVVAAARLEEIVDDRSAKLTLRVVPRFWLLKRRKRTRIFQRMRVLDVVASVLGQAGIGVAWQLVRAYPIREYCTQYEETDERFIRRILAEAGIFFSFFTAGPSGAAAGAATAMEIAGAAMGAASAIGVAPDALPAAAALAASLVPIPGDTLVCSDDAVCYPPVGHDDPVALAAATAASLALGAAEGAGLPGAIATAAAPGVTSAILAAASAAAPTLRYAPHDGSHVTHREQISRFTLRNTVRSSGATFRDYDPDRPLIRLQSTAVSTQPFPPSPAEIAAAAAAASANALSAVASAPIEEAIPGAGAAQGVMETVASVADAVLEATVPNEVYEHHGHYLFPKWDFAPDEAPLILRQKRRRASIAHGESGCATMSPGHRFALAGHPAAQIDGAYVVTRVEHRGALRSEERGVHRAYSNTFECAPAQMTYPPSRPKRKAVQVTLTATVVGPGTEEIYVDGRGRIKVQFHWDREILTDGQSSCWIRVMQPWGGAGWGAQFIPRVGMEVVVAFEGGDPDKPMILGTLYNGTHPTPFPLPHDKTRSGWRTQSSPGGEGHNELSFEDSKGSEQIYLHAQRNLDELVLNDHSTRVARDRMSTIGGDRLDDTAGSARYRIAKSRSEEIGESYSLAIGESRKLAIYGSDQEKVAGARTTHIEGTHGIQVGGTLSLMVGTQERASMAESFIWGHCAVGVDRSITVSAEDGITLRCGESTVEVTKDGIKLKGKTLSIEASKEATMTGNGPSIHLGDEGRIDAKTLNLVSSKASLVLAEDALLDGKEVKLNCKGIDPSSGSSEANEPQTKHLAMKLVDADAKPHANKEYVLSAGGARFEGTTDGSGMLELDVPKTAEVAQIVVYLEARPQGPQVRYRVAIEDMPSDSTKSALIRLKNLGYYWGEPSEELDDVAREAIRDFQRANGLNVTGELDGPTLAKLAQVHGH